MLHRKIDVLFLIILLGTLSSLGKSLADPTPATIPTSAPVMPASAPVVPKAGEPWTNSLGMKFTPISNLSVLFGIWDVRVKDYAAFYKATAAGSHWQGQLYDQSENNPAVFVDWNDAIAFCEWLTQKERAEGWLGSNQIYRLPTDSEWSIACGGGTYPWGDVWPPPNGVGNYAEDLTLDGYKRTSPVGSFPPNRYGLYDMGGNVWQWCMDWYHASMNSEELRKNDSYLNNDGGGEAYKVIRGGSFAVGISRPSSRRCDAPDDHQDDFGFRVVVEFAAPGQQTLEPPKPLWKEKKIIHDISEDPPAINFVSGCNYFSGKGCEQDYKQALKCFLQAAEKGYAPAQLMLGLMYEQGQGIPPDYEQAIIWVRKAAEQGSPDAQLNLGQMYYDGKITEQDYNEAMKWYIKAAGQGNAAAQACIGLSYEQGTGVIKDVMEALAWYNIAASQGSKPAISERDILEKELGPQNVLIAQKRAREILKQIQTNQAASQNNSTEPSDTTIGSNVPKCSGSGVLVSSTGLIVTAAHVVTDSNRFSVITANGTKSAKVVQIDTANDVALLRCDGTFTPVPVRLSQTVKLGESVFTIGFPDILVQGFSPKMTRGDISSLSGIQDDIRDWQISVPVQPGNSGGGLFDKHGNLVGVVVMKLDTVNIAKATGDVPQNVNYAVKSYYFMPLLDAQSVASPPMRTDSTGEEKIEDVVARVQKSAVLILAY